jgi:hypothetical protein
MFLGISKHAHDNKSHYDKSGDDVLQHGCHSMGLARCDVGFRSAKDKATPELRARRAGFG